MEYSATGDMKKTKANVSMYDIYTLLQQRDLLLNTFKYIPKTQHKAISTYESHHKSIENKMKTKNK